VDGVHKLANRAARMRGGTGLCMNPESVRRRTHRVPQALGEAAHGRRRRRVVGDPLGGALQACMTVVWLRPPNARPIAGSVWSVSSRARYMATWRGQATGGAARESESSIETPNASQVCSWISRDVRRAGASSG
jgi:hypothetical protein